MVTHDDLTAFAQQWIQDLMSRPRAAVTHRPVTGSAFLDVTIEGERYKGVVRGENIFLEGHTSPGACALGVASINTVGEKAGPFASWYLCKYRNQKHLALPLSPEGLRALAIEFGLPIIPLMPTDLDFRLREADYFYASPAFAALHSWATAKPRRVAGKFGDSYLGLWPLAALEGQQLAFNEANRARAQARAKTVPAS